MDNQQKIVAIIGGGASGLASAIAASRVVHASGGRLRVLIYERDDRVGRTILATGNGRCNFSNARIDVGAYRNAAFARSVFDSLARLSGTDDAVHAFFRSLGLVWREEADGRQYPLANKASAVLDVLRAAAARLGVVEVCDSEVAAIDPPHEAGKRFTLRMESGVLERADAVVIAAGGRALHALDMGEFPFRPFQPVLGPLSVTPAYRPITRELDNIRVRCAVALCRGKGRSGSDDARLQDGPDGSYVAAGPDEQVIALQRGELMFRKYGLSGICVFDLSRLARPGDVIRINFLEGMPLEEARQFIAQRYRMLDEDYGDGLTYIDMLRGLFLPRVADVLIGACGVDGVSRFTSRDIDGLVNVLTGYGLEIEGVADAGLCQVRRGGLEVSAIDASTMGVCDVPGLYAAGEALDVDGPCGGYNLHWAWASGMLAGESAATGLIGL